jgi:hypothetical protein
MQDVLSAMNVVERKSDCDVGHGRSP